MSAPTEPSPRRIALYGGSFDPPHVAHVLAATWVLCRAGVDELRLVPTFEHAFHKALAPFDDRIALLEAAMAHLGPQVVVDPIERELGDTSYTIHTVQEIRRREPDAELSWVLGADAWGTRERWHRWPELEGLVEWIVMGRAGTPPPTDVVLACHLPRVSSTEVRAALTAGQPVDHLVAPEVRAEITSRGLYR